ncbi:MAG TPA: response regulator [Burkholderiaceae bacterium]|nr:response regulator [Burkholderiaceae bacterium]
MLRILVIEKDSAMQTLICEWLGAEGYATRGISMVAADPVWTADIVVVDLPNLRSRGCDTLRAVRESHPHAALVGLSTHLGRSLRSNSASAHALGLRRLVAKPCTRQELLGAVSEALGTAP